MNTSACNCITVMIMAFLAGIAAFILSILNVFSFELIANVLYLGIIAAIVLYAVFFYGVLNAEKNRVIREAFCCCGKLAIIGFIGTIIFALMTLLLYNGTVKVLFDLGLGFTFLFLTMALAGIGCVLTGIYQCSRNNCQ